MQENKAAGLFATMEGALVAGLIVTALVVGLTALLAPPNTWDAMSYHLPRVVYWLQHRSVRFYSTPEIQQLFQPPWAEYAMLHLQALSLGDRFGNLVQWFSFCGCAVAASLVAALLGANKQGQVIAAVVCATIPQGLLSASGTKNDYVLSFWLICLVYFLLRARPRASWFDTAYISASMGLALLTKGTAYIYAIPILLFGSLMMQPTWTVLWARRWHIVAVLGIVFALNFGQYSRNVGLFGGPLGPGTAVPGGCPFANGTYGASTLFSNIVRNLALHVSTPNARFNGGCQRIAVNILHTVGIDPDDPQTTWCGSHFGIPAFGAIEDSQSNPLHLSLLLLTLILIAAKKCWRRGKAVRLYALVPVMAFLLFCLLLRWQPWHTRLHLPLFVLSSPLIGLVLARTLPSAATAFLGMTLFITSGPLLFGNELRPLLIRGRMFSDVLLNEHRRDFYFAARPDYKDSYTAAANRILESGCRDVGINSYGNNQIYPMLVLLGAGVGETRIHALDVSNVSARYARRSTPCALLYMSRKAAVPGRLLPGYSVVNFGEMLLLSAGPSSGRGGRGADARIKVMFPSPGSGPVGDLTITIPRESAVQNELVEVLVSPMFAGNNACWVQVNRAANVLALVKDSGDGTVGLSRFGERAVLKNSQCMLDGSRSFVQQIGGDVTLNLHIEMTPAFAGTKTIFLRLPLAGQPSEWQTGGAWEEAK